MSTSEPKKERSQNGSYKTSDAESQNRISKKLSTDERQKYINDTDYSIVLSISARGPVKKNDIMGAVYKHNASILEQLTIENLQIKRRLGRFEIELQSDNVNTYGQIIVPIKGTDVQAAIIAGSLQTIDRIGPFTSTFTTEKIRFDKQHLKMKVFENARVIYNTKFETVLNNLAEFKKLLAVNNEKLNILELGNNIYAGPHYTNKELYIVEGIADVRVLAKYKVYNTLSVNGADFNPADTDKYLLGKVLTVIADGDRGGSMLLQRLCEHYKVSYVVQVPENKSVQNLTKEEVFNALYHNKKPYIYEN